MNNNILAEAMNIAKPALKDTTLDLVDDKLFVSNPMHKNFSYYIEQYSDVFTISFTGRMHFINKRTVQEAVNYIEALYICNAKPSSPCTKFDFSLSSAFKVDVYDKRLMEPYEYYTMTYHEDNNRVTVAYKDGEDIVGFDTAQKALDFIEARFEEQYKEQKEVITSKNNPVLAEKIKQVSAKVMKQNNKLYKALEDK